MDHEQESWLRALAQRLLEGGPRELTLDEIGDALGERAVGASEVELLFSEIERGGGTVGGRRSSESGASEGLALVLRQVLQCARELREAGQRPQPTLIAERSGLSARAVRVALLYADVLRGG